jgi:hypothetical protein
MSMQMVELHFSEPPRCDYAAIKARAQAILGEELDASDPGKADKAFLLFHKNHPIEYREGAVPAQTVVLAANEMVDLAKYQGEIEQSWGFRDCAQVLQESRHTLLVTEMMARALPPGERVRLFHGVLQAVIEVTGPQALVFKHTQQVVQPQAYLDAVGEESKMRPITRPGALNVRFFRIADPEGDMLMDTRGLEETGLHDLQCHFRQLDPNEVSRVLYNTALYIFEKGPVIESGNTVAGIAPDSMWRCQFEDALLEPKREVLDLDPGQPFAAGNRH